MDDLSEFEFPEEGFERLEDEEFVNEQLAQGKTYQEILGYTDEAMEKFYHAAVALFQREEYERGAEAFVYLTCLNQNNPLYWIGLAMCEQQRGEYETALTAYKMALVINPDDASSYYHAGLCYLSMQDSEHAKEYLKSAISHAEEIPELKSIKEQAVELMSSLP